MKWFSIWWWKYLFEKRTNDQKLYEIPFYRIVICRIRNHPNGVTWYNVYGMEPDMRCRDCMDELG